MLTLASLDRYTKSRGQSMTEYVIIVGLIAIFCIGMFTLFGHQIRNTASSIINKVSGSQAIHTNVTQEDTANEDEIKDTQTQMKNF